MKKTLLISSAVLLTLAATSCDDNNKNDWDTDSFNIQTKSSAVIIPLSADEEPQFVADYTLRFTQTLADGKVSVKSMTPVTLPDGKTLSFESPATNITGNSLTNIIEPLPFTTPDGLTLRLQSRLTQQYYNYDAGTGRVLQVSNFPISLSVLTVGGDYKVKTFQQTACFAGNTITLVDGDNPYSTSDIAYELSLDMANKKATVTLYNAKFAAAAPNIRVLRLRNLTLRADRSSGYVVEGEGIVPEVLEGSEWVPNQRFTFDSFKVLPTNENLSLASITYRVAGHYTGSCNASYIVQ